MCNPSVIILIWMLVGLTTSASAQVPHTVLDPDLRDLVYAEAITIGLAVEQINLRLKNQGYLASDLLTEAEVVSSVICSTPEALGLSESSFKVLCESVLNGYLPALSMLHLARGATINVGAKHFGVAMIRIILEVNRPGFARESAGPSQIDITVRVKYESYVPLEK